MTWSIVLLSTNVVCVIVLMILARRKPIAREFTPAFPTGSRVYGNPRKTSDYDLVILCAPSDLAFIRQACLGVRNEYKEHASFRFGQLNLIATTSIEEYSRWESKRSECLAQAREERRGLTRAEAVRIHHIGESRSAGSIQRS